jgi:glycosyltransferase involved in cell wall biosynthesis
MSALISAIRRTETMKPLKSSAQPRILAVNVFFAPFSFGGATVLLEQLMETLPGNLDRAVFTCNQLPELPEYALFKYEEKGSLVYSCKVEGLTLDKHDVSHPTLAEVFKAVLAEYRPDIVHFHSTQGMGIELISLAKGFGARVVVTSHDAWWICARQFMMKADKTWCGQQQIDLKICASCTGEPGPTFKRFQVLSRTLEQADVILTPSSYQRGILVQNLPASLRIEVNKNGIVHPHTLQELRVRAPGERIRFGFLGGLGAEHKGYDLVMDVFRNLNRDNFELRLVDLGQKLGHLPAKLPDDLRMKDKVVLVPPFSASDAANFYSQMDVLIAPSKIPESFGMAAREALLYGCHVIVSRLGGVVEDLDGRPGVHFLEDVSKEALHKVVAGMLAQGLPRHSQGPAKRFTSPEEQARELLAIYQSLA